MQSRRRNSKFTVMAAGAAGAGKSTLLNNLVGRQIINTRSQREVDIYMINLDGIGVSQNIVFIDTPGFGTRMNDEALQESLIVYIKEQFDNFIEEESKIRRNPHYSDSRVHCLLYLVPATCSRLRQSDIHFLRRAAEYVNIVPVITKADALSEEEKVGMQQQITDQLTHYSIPYFDFSDPECMPSSGCADLITAQPFTTICSSFAGDVVAFRKHAASSVDLDNRSFSDLSLLRELLFGSFMEILVDVTVSELYERYRVKTLESSINAGHQD